MEQNKLVIQTLSYCEKNAPPITYNLLSTQILQEQHPDLLEHAFKAILGNPHASAWLQKRSISLEATVTCGGFPFRIAVQNGVLRAWIGGADCTEKYLHYLRHTREEMDLVCFRQPKGYPLRLSQYRLGRISTLRYTRPVGYTATFQFHMRRFIREFQPQRLVPGKELFLHLFRDGTFRVHLGDDENPTLSETEQTIYYYLCFLHLQRFWAQILERHSLDGPVLPVIIPNVLNRIDGSIDREEIIRCCSQLNRQILFIE